MRLFIPAAVAALVVVVASCGDSRPEAGAGSPVYGQGTGNACATPQTGCPCTPGAVVPCGKEVTSDFNFIYCYEGKRACSPLGVFGECAEGTIVPQSLASIHPHALGASGACNGADPGPLKVCTTGKFQGEVCTSNLDCFGGTRQCAGGSRDGQHCDKQKDCPDPGDCLSFDGTCTGGTRDGFGCNALADCPGGTACTPAGSPGICGNYVGICNNGTADGEACNSDTDCPGGNCEGGHGHCVGGKDNGKKCKHNKHCWGTVACTAEVDAGALALDPCDPYCNTFTDTAFGLDAGGFKLVDGGLTPAISGAVCGNGAKEGAEQCDDGNTTNGDGCSSICRIEIGWQCPTPGSPCIAATCGNGIIEGAEQCDDGNIRPYDGCSPTCQKDFNCPAGMPCVAVCGDGLKFPSEACDDGNTADGDGCSSTCTVESGATCTTITAPNPAYIDVPILYRDFNGSTHVDFQMNVPHGCSGAGCCNTSGASVGIAAINLAADKAPTFAAATNNCVAGAADFNQFYRDVPGTNIVVLGKYLRLQQTMAGTYVFDSSADTAWNLPNINCGNAAGPTTRCNNNYAGFYPINGLGYGNWAATGKNYHFTSELRVPFTFQGGEVLSFTGDDDVFVYIAGKKVVDLGGIHTPVSGSVTLNAAGFPTMPASSPVVLTVGQTYEFDVFQAERNTTGSNYKLTLQGFNRQISQCTAPPASMTYVRDFEGVCTPGYTPVWQLFRWQAAVPAGASIDFRAATAGTQAALPAAPPPAAPVTVPIGQANPTNSPAAGPVTWQYDTAPGPVPVPVSQHLAVDGAGQKSQQWLRVYMKFSGPALLYQWQQLYDCVPNE